MMIPCSFEYTQLAQSFLGDRIDENDKYSIAADIFEYFVKKDPEIGDSIVSAPVVIRRFPVMIPTIEPLAFYYYTGKSKTKMSVVVFKIEFQKDLPIYKKAG